MKIDPVDGLGHREQLRMPVQPQARVGRVQHAANHVDDVLRRIRRREVFRHPGRMTTVAQVRPANRIAERPHHLKHGRLKLRVVGRAALRVDLCTLADGRPFEQRFELCAEIIELVAIEHTFEDVEAVARIRFDDGRVERAVDEPQRTAGCREPGRAAGRHGDRCRILRCAGTLVSVLSRASASLRAHARYVRRIKGIIAS